MFSFFKAFADKFKSQASSSKPIEAITANAATPQTEQVTPLQEPVAQEPAPAQDQLNWNDINCKVSKYFTVHEATYLPNWGIHHQPSDEEKANILKMAEAMDKVRDLFGAPIIVHCWIRPVAANCPGSVYHGQNYNKLVGGATHSAHITGSAVDWHTNVSCDLARAKLAPELDSLAVCMENLPGSGWVHLDIAPPRGGKVRYFIP